MQPVSRLLILFITLLIIFTACKKNTQELVATPPPVITPPPTTPPPPSSDVLKDSALFYARDLYLWENQIPATFNARSYADLNLVMEGIRPYSIEPGFTSAVDRWSFAMKKTEWDQMSGGIGSLGTSTGADGDFGLSVFFKAEGDLRIRLVEPSSPAGISGIRRSWKVLQINGNNNMTTGNADFIVNAVYYASVISMTLQRPDGSQTNVSLNAAHYPEKPVYLDTVYNYNDKKIGYLVYNSFLGNITGVLSEFQRVFDHFAAAGVTDVVVDLRYNGGGYVSLQEKLANYLAPFSANGGVMMKQVYNNKNSQYNSTTNFQKTGSVSLNKVYFIVGRGTASASELLINNLKPYMDVKLIGTGNTHGKPVGFFPVPVGEWYVFPVSFKTTNKNGEGNYYNGFTVNAQVADGLDKEWGDINEASLASAIRNITTGAYLVPERYTEPTNVSAGNNKLDEPLLKVTIGTKR
ncbi:MAG TPA: S41 family peptidase [Ferruginibacter sp.]|nr:S41 family peptidase [Ferruginibacter sp.]